MNSIEEKLALVTLLLEEIAGLDEEACFVLIYDSPAIPKEMAHGSICYLIGMMEITKQRLAVEVLEAKGN